MNVAHYVTAFGCTDANELNILWASISLLARQAARSMLSAPWAAFDADDIAQEASLKLLDSLTRVDGQWWEGGRPVTSLKGLIRRITRNCMIDLMRRHARDGKRSEIFAIDCYAPAVPVTPDQKIDARRIFDDLTPAQRDTVMTAALDRGAPAGNTANQRKARVRQVISKHLEDIEL